MAGLMPCAGCELDAPRAPPRAPLGGQVSTRAASGATPSIGPERGGTRVTVLGGGFRDAYTLRCAFGSSTAPVLARYVDESQLECTTPFHAAGSAAVLLSMNGQQYASSGVSFTYQPSASVSYILSLIHI